MFLRAVSQSVYRPYTVRSNAMSPANTRAGASPAPASTAPETTLNTYILFLGEQACPMYWWPE